MESLFLRKVFFLWLEERPADPEVSGLQDGRKKPSEEKLEAESGNSFLKKGIKKTIQRWLLNYMQWKIMIVAQALFL